LPFIGPVRVLRGPEVLTGIQVTVEFVGRLEHLGRVLSVWVAAWGNRLVVR
jgi:hypothetical protein